jgi:hypothetical protein
LPVAAVAALLLGSFGVLFLWHGLVAIYHVHLKGPKPRRRPSGRSTGDAVVGSLRSEEGQPQAEIAPTHEGAAPATGFNAWLREHEPAMTFVSWATGIVLFALAVLDRF